MYPQHVAAQTYCTLAATFITQSLQISNLFSVSVPLITWVVYKQLPDAETLEKKKPEREILLPKKYNFVGPFKTERTLQNHQRNCA
jgi:hypothetical protein